MSAPPLYYPPADRKAQWFAGTFPGTDMGGVDKVLLHTTEGSSWPPYKGGSEAPNLTYHPGERKWRQHFPLNRSARALCDPASTSVRENRDRVVQVEIIAVCDPSVSRRSTHLLDVDNISDEALHDLGLFLAWMHAAYRVPLVAAPKWLPYPRSAGNSPVRMSGPQYAAARGILGHQHASGNDHGDPGSLNVARIIYHANKAALLADSALPLLAPLFPVPGTVAVRPPLEDDMYGMVRTLPDGRYYGTAGLQCTHLETEELRTEWMTKVAHIKPEQIQTISLEMLAQFQRIT